MLPAQEFWNAIISNDLPKLKQVAPHCLEALNEPIVEELKLNYPIIIAAHLGYDEIVDFLIDLGVDCNVQDEEGNTCLHEAVYEDRYDIADALLNDGNSDPSIQNINGQTARDISEMHQLASEADDIGLYPEE